MQSKVVCVIPTRGLMYAETIQGVLQNLDDEKRACSIPEIISQRPMPECFNEGVRRALELEATHVWFVEEDNEVPPGVLTAMLDMDQPIVTMDYNVGKGVSHIYTDERGDILWCGLGCTLIKTEVFKKIADPWFEVDKTIDIQTKEIREIQKEVVGKKYGGHDVLFFYIKAKSHQYHIARLSGWKGRHFRTAEIPKRELNNGFYTITSL